MVDSSVADSFVTISVAGVKINKIPDHILSKTLVIQY